MTKIVMASKDALQKASELLRDGGLVAMPTETVYGLAANALDGQAVAKIYEAKGRPSFNPLIVHFARSKDVEPYALIDERAKILAHAFWPGPLTMILPRKEQSGVSELVTAGLDTIAVRVPAHPVARDLIAAAGVPLAAPSANKSGSISPTTAAHVYESLGEAVDMILAGGPSEVGLESTVIDLSGEHPAILRPGGITAEDISEVLERHVAYDLGDAGDVKSPGQLLKHYAPGIPVRLNAIDLQRGEALLAFGSTKFMGIKGGGAASSLPETQIKNLSEEGDLHEAAANLFAMLRALDRQEHSAIAVMSVPGHGLGIAINDRLKRAASSE